MQKLTCLHTRLSCLYPPQAHNSLTLCAITTSSRNVSSNVFDHPPFTYRKRHTFNTLPMHDANKFGGRAAYLRQIGPIDHKKAGRLFKRDFPTLQFNVDVWAAQQTLRKKWKARDWQVVQLPFSHAPRELQRVLPQLYTDVPQMTDPASGDYSNIRNKVYDREELQSVLYGGEVKPYPDIQFIDKKAMTLDKFL